MRIFKSWRMAALVNGLRDATAYRTEFFIDFAGSAFLPAAIQWVLWYAMFRVNGTPEINGFTYATMVQYTLTSMLFTQIRGGDHDFELMEMIRTGSLSQYLLRPVGVVEFFYIRGVSSKLVIAGFCLFAGCIVGSFFGLSPFRICGAMFMALLGNIIHYQIGAAIATAAFYWEEAYSVLMVKNLFVSFLSGELIPLFLFPQHLEWIWKSTPFYLYVYGPVQYATGKWTHEYFLSQLGMCCIWLVVGWALIKITWGIGIKKYASIGG